TGKDDFIAIHVNALSRRAFDKIVKLTYPTAIKDNVSFVAAQDRLGGVTIRQSGDMEIMEISPGRADWEVKIVNDAGGRGKPDALEDPPNTTTVTVGDDDQ
ncbi:MAG: hypothetical protein GY940_43085, partial [bacterium]|nr:hypothetical protein [bacterium]